VLDDDGNGTYDVIGYAETTLGHILGSRNQTFLADLKKEGKTAIRGKIIVRADSIKESNWEVTMKVSGINLPNTTLLLCCENNHPCLELYRASGQNQTQFLKVFTSEVVHNSRNPIFNQIKISGTQLCNSNQQLPI